MFLIINKGNRWYATIGTEMSKGAKDIGGEVKINSLEKAQLLKK